VTASRYAIDPGEWPALPIVGRDQLFPVRRVYCVGRNYADHAREMGASGREAPFFFQKPADAIVPPGGAVPYPPLTANLHHEVEWVLAIGAEGADLGAAEAASLVFGMAVGIDLTRRDLQATAREAGRPWEIGKAFDHSAPCSAIKPLNGAPLPGKGRISLSVNDALRQDGDLSQMIWNASEVLQQLSKAFRLMPGDLIFTGTPSGVGPLEKGDRVDAAIEGVAELSFSVF